MFNLKLTIYGAVFGLIVSIFFGIVGGVQFGVIVLRAFISSLLCGSILALASFLYERFLSDSSTKLSAEEGTSAVGGVVDIRIDEDVLPDTDNAPDFYVKGSFDRKSLQEEDAISSTNSVVNNSVNVQNVQQVENSKATDLDKKLVTDEKLPENSKSSPSQPEGGSEQFVPTSLAKEKYKSSTTPEQSIGESLDSLPELGSIVSEMKNEESEVIQDSAFAEGEKSSSVEFIPDAVVGADTTLMAEAIKTLLRREG
jgi:hypothetical protein